jgi:hypothetical protein
MLSSSCHFDPWKIHPVAGMPRLRIREDGCMIRAISAGFADVFHCHRAGEVLNRLLEKE